MRFLLFQLGTGDFKVTEQVDQNWAIVGLGNPGSKYSGTRHNAGFWAIAALAKSLSVPGYKSYSGCEFAQCNIAGKKVFLVMPQQFMNRSGSALRPFADYYKIPLEQICVIHDELDLDPGVLRLRLGGSAAGHNGLKDIIQHFGSDKFYRARIGIGHPRTREEFHSFEVSDYVLSQPRSEELRVLEHGANRAAEACSLLVEHGLLAAQQQFHKAE